jgi:hypothetical protein
LKLGLKLGGASRDRTGDLLHAMQALSQLSYGPTFGRRHLNQMSLIPQAFAAKMSCIPCDAGGIGDIARNFSQTGNDEARFRGLRA